MVDGWPTGEVVIHRYVGHGDGIIWCRPHLVVFDTAEFTALYQPEGTIVHRFDLVRSSPVDPRAVRMNVLRLMFPGRAHAVLLFFDAGTGVPPWYEQHFNWPHGDFKGWKIDIESPFKRTPIGFDTTDNVLDVIVRPDMSWSWKDEAGLARRVRQGVFTPSEAESFYAEGLRAIARVEQQLPPFSDPWPEWRPDPSWPLPHALDGWETLSGGDIDMNRNAPYRPIRGTGDRTRLQAVTVRLVKRRRPAVTYEADVLADDGNHIVIRAPWKGDPIDLGVVEFEEGDMFIEHYWRDRWYSVKRVHGADRALKGWYCDIARPATLEGTVLTSVDLDLDLWVSSDRRKIRRLDEEEFVDGGWWGEDPAAASAAVAGLDELERQARAGAFPFR